MKTREYIRRLAAVLLCAALLCGALSCGVMSVSAATLVNSYDTAKIWYSWFGYDIANTTTADANDYIIKFNSGSTTGTNSNWYEFVINQYGYVTSLGGYNSAIPSGGAVVAVNRNGEKGQAVIAQVSVGDVINVNEYPYFTVYRTTADDKRASRSYNTDSSSTFALTYAKVAGITTGGTGVTTGSSVWQNDVLIKRTADGSDTSKAGKGYVVSVGGNNIDVPAGYFAITFDGQSLKDDGTNPYNGAQFAKEYMPIGTLVNCGSNEIYIRHDNAAAVRAAKLLAGVLDTVTDSSLAISAVEDCAVINDIEKAENTFKLVDTDQMRSLYNNMVEIANGISASDSNLVAKLATIYQNYNAIYKLNAEKKTVEYRATWVSSFRESQMNGKTAEQLDAMIEAEVQDIVDKGYNMIMYEVFHNSCTVMPMNGAGYDGISYAQNPYLTPEKNDALTKPYDMLAKYIEVCHQKGVELHVWMQAFYVGYQRTNGATDALFEYSVAQKILDNPTKYKNWLNTASNGDLFFGAESDGALQYFLNPGSTGARTFLLNTFSYIWNTYDIDGFHLDYIRYAKTDNGKCFGYDDDTLWAFKQAYPQYAEYTDEQLKDSSFFLNSDWVSFRANYVTTFVGDVHDTMFADRPDIYLTAATGADYTEAKNYLMQDLQTWFDNGYIDILFPMAYGENVVKDSTAKLVAGNSTKFACSGVSGSYSAEFEYMWLQQIREAGADGIGVFGLTDSYYNDGPFTVKAVTPTGNAAKAAMTYLDDTVAQRAQKMLDAAAITTAQYNSIVAAIETAEKSVRFNGVEGAYDELNALNTIAAGLSNAYAKEALKKDAAYLLKIRSNSRDAAAQQRELSSDTGLTVNGVDVAKTDAAFTYTTATNTLYISSNNVAISGSLAKDLSIVLADDVNSVIFDNVTLTAQDAYPALESTGSVTVKLVGTNNISSAVLSNIQPTYIGTGRLTNGDALVMCKGDLDGNEKVDTADIRRMLQAIVTEKPLTAEQTLIGDVDGDGRVLSYDARVFLSVALKG